MYIKINNKDIYIINCKSFFSRLKGFMFTKKEIKTGLLFEHCSSIHTFFMFQPIDVVLLDKDNNVVKCYEGLRPNRIILPKKSVKKVLELPINSAKYINKKSLIFFNKNQ